MVVVEVSLNVAHLEKLSFAGRVGYPRKWEPHVRETQLPYLKRPDLATLLRQGLDRNFLLIILIEVY